MVNEVYVVTGFELGWDNVVAVYDANTVDVADLEVEYPEDRYYIDKHKVSTNA